MEEQKYIYVMGNDLFIVDNVRKYGYTTNPHQRLIEANTQLPRSHYYEHLWIIDVIPKHCKGISVHDKVITTTLNTQHNYKINKFEHGGGTEFFQGEPLEIKRIFTDKGYILKDITLDDINKQNNKSIMSPKKLPIKYVLGLEIEAEKKVGTNQKWQTRDYQQKAIEHLSTKIKENGKIYIELATGSGKSYIVFNILRNIKSKIIIILSPRKIVNKQNVKSDYVNILDSPTHIYDLTDDNFNSFKKFYNKDGNKIIVACVQSFEKVLKYIDNYDMNDVCIWFDEAHWGLENWLSDNTHNSKRLLLEDTSRIAYRIFTSASPYRDVIKSNQAIFGELYRPLKVSELINDKWLCPISPFVFCEDKEGVDVLDYMLVHFKENNKNWGFSFHHNQMNAFIMFYEHYKRYEKGVTKIKPFLLISNDGCTITIDEYLQFKNTHFIDLKIFESTKNSIAYVVAKYSMGYDFKGIDNICFSDYKMSSKDIIQSIGRGTRPDTLGLNGRNKNKKLDVLLPVYPYSEDIDKYYRIAEVLAYLVGEVEIPLDKIIFTYGKRQENNNNKDIVMVDYDSIDFVRSKVFEVTRFILNREKKITYNYIKELNKKLHFHSRDDYLQSEECHQCFISDPETTFKQEWISWYDFIGLNTSIYLQTKDEFISYCKNNDITSCDEYNKHYSLNKNKTLPQDPFQMYPNFTNWNDEMKGEDDFIW
jgi:hypothetical protein